MQNQNGWTDARRARQAALIHKWKPWLAATGPRTTEGKAITSKNASKPNSLRQQLLVLMADLKGAARLIKKVEARRKHRR